MKKFLLVILSLALIAGLGFTAEYAIPENNSIEANNIVVSLGNNNSAKIVSDGIKGKVAVAGSGIMDSPDDYRYEYQLAQLDCAFEFLAAPDVYPQPKLIFADGNDLRNLDLITTIYDEIPQFTINYNGQDWICDAFAIDQWSDIYVNENGNFEATYSVLFAVNVPAGYEGIVIGFASSGLPDGGSLKADYKKNGNNFVLYQLNNLEYAQ